MSSDKPLSWLRSPWITHVDSDTGRVVKIFHHPIIRERLEQLRVSTRNYRLTLNERSLIKLLCYQRLTLREKKALCLILTAAEAKAGNAPRGPYRP